MEEQTKEVIDCIEVSSLEETSSMKLKPKRKSIKKNYFYNLVYQMFMLIVPLVVTPYVSRVLTPEGIGQYSFSFSLITYFTIFGALGYGYYAQREIAKNRNDKYKQTLSFWEMNISRLIPVSLALSVNLILCFLGAYNDYTQLMLIFSINIIAIAFDISFLYQGNEEFGKLVIRNLIVKAISIVSIFLFVRKNEDLWIYALINSLSVILSSIIMWAVAFKLLTKINFNELKPLRHIKGTIVLFLPTIAVSIYTILDKTLIGFLIKESYSVTEIKEINGVSTTVTVVKKYSDLENGYYEQSEKIIKMILTVITSIGTVMIPRNTHEFSIGNTQQVKKNLVISSNLVMLIGIPLVLGVIAIAPNFVPWFFGSGYDKCIQLMRILSPLILIIGFSNVLGLQYLVPSGQDNKFTIALIIGAVINLSLNIFMIYFWWSIGAAIATVIAELIVTFVMAIMARKEVNIIIIIFKNWRSIISGVIMFLICYYIEYKLSSSILNTAIIAATGIMCYITLLIIFRERCIINILSKIIRIIRRK